MKKIILSLALCCLFGSILPAQDWVMFTQSTPQSPIIDLIQSDNQQVEFTVEVCGMFKTDLTEEGESFQRIEIPGAGKTDETGEPELPYIRQLIAIPECEGVVLTVNIIGHTDFNDYNIFPAPDYEEVQNPGGAVYLQEVFYKNDTVYEQNIYMPGINAEIVSTGYLRGQKYVEVYIYPIQFNPVSKHINVYTNYELILDFINPAGPVNVNTGIFNNVATNTMLNYVSSGISASINDNMQGNGNVQWINLTSPSQADNIVADYLIICSEEFFQPNEPNSEVLRIANHRATYNGFDVAILNAETIISDELGFYYEGLEPPQTQQYKKEQRIRTCIRRVYEGENAQHTYDNKVGYVLLIGDVDDDNLGMPTSYNHEYHTWGNPDDKYPADYYYSCVTPHPSDTIDYDETGDLFIGRFCVDNNLQNGLTELHNVVSKTIYFESEATFGGWHDEVGVLLGDSINLDPEYIEAYFNFIDGLLPPYFTFDFLDATQPTFVEQDVYDVINDDGVMLFIYNGHGNINGWFPTGDISIVWQDFQDSLANHNKPSVMHAISCATGNFDTWTLDCVGEFLVTYSETDGFVGYYGAGRGVYGSTGLYNGEPLYLQELIPYTIFEHLSHITGEYILESTILSNPNFDGFQFNLFGDPALNVMAQGFEVTHDITLADTTIISNEITVKNGATLTIPVHGQLGFEQNGKLIIEEGATVVFSDHAEIYANNVSQIINDGELIIDSNVNFEAVEDAGIEIVSNGNLTIDPYAGFIALENARIKLEINGNFSIGSFPNFIAVEGAVLEIDLNNISIQDTFNYAIFERCKLSVNIQDLTISNTTFEKSEFNGYAQLLTITNSTFTDCESIYFYNANINISNSTFTGTWLYIDNFEDNSLTATISDCNFTDESFFYTQASIYLLNYDQYLISNNTIEGYYNGIQIVQSGLGQVYEHIIMFNSISNCGNSGIMIYNSISDIYRNQIFNNRYGVWFGNRNSIQLHGILSAGSNEETQQIINNDEYEVYASQYSFPIYFRYNVIVDEDNASAGDPMVYYSEGTGGMTIKDVRYNCWGNNFDPTEDLFPGEYIWDPIWCPGGGDNRTPGPDEDMYEIANNLFETEDYIGAKSMYEMLIGQYPQSKFAKTAMQELFALEKFVSDDYNNLKQYYANNGIIQSDTVLNKLSGFLINKCDLKLEDWETAILWYENIIQNPETMEDSIFAIIDLGYAYRLMENSGQKSAYTGNLIQYKPESKEQFIENRNYLLSLIPGDKAGGTIQGNIAELKEGELLQNVPNPFTGTTQIWYKLEKESNIQLNVYNYNGQLIKSIDEGSKTKGTHYIEFDACNLNNGLYFYSISINGKRTDSKKMTIMK